MYKSRLLLSLMSNLLTIGESNIPYDLENYIPMISADLVSDILDEFLRNNVYHTSLLNVKQPVIVVGDIHGDLYDVFRILNRNGLPPQVSYLFLGDYIDRGRYPLQTLLLLMALHNVYPQNFSLLRGNHEIGKVCEQYGFLDVLKEHLGDDLLKEKFCVAFSYLPLAAIIDNRYFCVHGGISKYLTSLSVLLRITMPVREITPLIEDLLWSDPSNTNDAYTPSQRNKGHQFGSLATEYFLKHTNLSYIIRAHSFAKNGAYICHSAKVISLFSSSHYVEGGNVATIAFIDGIHVFEKLYPENRCRRSESILAPLAQENKIANSVLFPTIVRPRLKEVTPKFRQSMRF